LSILDDIVFIIDEDGYVIFSNIEGLNAFNYHNGNDTENLRFTEIPTILKTIDLAEMLKGRAVHVKDLLVKQLPYDISIALHKNQENNGKRLFITKMTDSSKPKESIKHISLESQGIVGASKIFKDTLNHAKILAQNNGLLLITGESGSGKEIVADLIHKCSHRNNAKYQKINCSALTETLLESELFGYEKGAFTGALEAKKGLLEECNGGTVLLDEIGYISLRMQAVLLRVLQDQQIRRLGGTTNIQCDIRFIVLSNINLKEAIDRGDFREDLYHRLNVFPLEMPPLRKRGNDSIELTYHFCKKHQTSLGKKITFIDQDAIDRIFFYEWPGNVRELENTIQRAMLTSKEGIITAEDIVLGSDTKKQDQLQHDNSLKKRLHAYEYRILRSALTQCEYNISKTARFLEIPKQTLFNKIKRFNLH